MSSLFSKDLWSEIIAALKSNGTRTFITAFGVFWGIFIMVLLLATSRGFETGVKHKFSGIATNSIFLWAMSTSKEYKGLPKNRSIHFNMEDMKAIKDNVKGVRVVSPSNSFSAVITHGLRQGSFNVEGKTPDFTIQQAVKLTQGRFINQNDINLKRKVAIIGWALIDEFFEKGETVLGSFIKVKGVNFKVVGVYKDTSIFARGDVSAQQKVYLPFNTFSQVFNISGKVGSFMITGYDDVSISKVKEDVISVLKKRQNIHPEDKNAIGNFDLNSRFEEFNMLFKTLSGVSFFVGLMILLSGVIGISNIMLIVIKERTKEIGIRRALGATPGIVKKQILLEAVFLTILSGMAGVSFSVLILFIANLQLDAIDPFDTMVLNPIISITTLFIIFLTLIIFGLLAGMIPARQAVKMKPINAIRTE